VCDAHEHIPEENSMIRKEGNVFEVTYQQEKNKDGVETTDE
jgi:hypothetical protein